MKQPPLPTEPNTPIVDAATLPREQTPQPAPEAWEEFLEEEGDCCGGCHHKPR